MELKQGEILGLVGENGNGKTTLLRSLCGELHPTSGTINYQFQYDDLYDLRTKLVYIPQRTDTWRGSMYENLEFTASCYGYSPEENNLVVDLVITRLGLRKFRKHYWNNLSSGYKMRFELARMLLRKPKILLIDEPSNKRTIRSPANKLLKVDSCIALIASTPLSGLIFAKTL